MLRGGTSGCSVDTLSAVVLLCVCATALRLGIVLALARAEVFSSWQAPVMQLWELGRKHC